VQIPPDERNTRLPAILMPAAIGEVLPFRYAEVEGSTSMLDAASVRQITVHYPFDDQASYFASSDTVLNTVWGIHRHDLLQSWRPCQRNGVASQQSCRHIQRRRCPSLSTRDPFLF
jgi:hypothetical protein